MKDKIKVILIIAGIFVALAMLFVVNFFINRIPENPSGTV